MGLSYEKLFKILKAKDISKSELASALNLSSRTVSKLSKNEAISMVTIITICEYLNCQPGDIMELEKEIDENTLLYKLIEEKKEKRKNGIYQKMQINTAYKSNHMEGNMLTKEQVIFIYKTNMIKSTNGLISVDSIVETINHFQGFNYMIDHANDTLDEEFIKELHKILRANTSNSRIEGFYPGEYREEKNNVEDMKTVSQEDIHIEMEKLFFKYNKKPNILEEDILDFYVRFEQIFPFREGTGQIGQLIILKECLKYNISPIIIDGNKKLKYPAFDR